MTSRSEGRRLGDIAHSRVCGSLIPALKIMGCETYAVAPGTLLPPAPRFWVATM